MLLETSMSSGTAESAKGCDDFLAYVAKEELVEAALHARGCSICNATRRAPVTTDT